jgi:plasmid stabilization system protein ParE
VGVTVSLTGRALSDLSDIRDYLIPISPQGAESVRRAIAETIALLAQYPNVGRETDITSVRVLPVVQYPYLIYHAVREDEVVILHIRHGARAQPKSEDLR